MSADPLTVHLLGADLNAYAYVRGRALRSVDPLGLQESNAAPPSGQQYAADGQTVAITNGQNNPSLTAGTYAVGMTVAPSGTTITVTEGLTPSPTAAPPPIAPTSTSGNPGPSLAQRALESAAGFGLGLAQGITPFGWVTTLPQVERHLPLPKSARFRHWQGGGLIVGGSGGVVGGGAVAGGGAAITTTGVLVVPGVELVGIGAAIAANGTMAAVQGARIAAEAQATQNLKKGEEGGTQEKSVGKPRDYPSRDASGKVHGDLPKAEDLKNLTRDELEHLHKELRLSVEERNQLHIDRGRQGGHGDRQAQEQQLIQQIEKELETRPDPPPPRGR